MNEIGIVLLVHSETSKINIVLLVHIEISEIKYCWFMWKPARVCEKLTQTSKSDL